MRRIDVVLVWVPSGVVPVLLTPNYQVGFLRCWDGEETLRSAATFHWPWLSNSASELFCFSTGIFPPSGTNMILPESDFLHFWTYLSSSAICPAILVKTLSTSLCLQVYLPKANWQFERMCFMVPNLTTPALVVLLNLPPYKVHWWR